MEKCPSCGGWLDTNSVCHNTQRCGIKRTLTQTAVHPRNLDLDEAVNKKAALLRKLIPNIEGEETADPLQNEYLASLYSDIATTVAGAPRKVVFGDRFQTDLQGTIVADAYPAGKHAHPGVNLLLTRKGILHELAHEEYADPNVLGEIFKVAANNQPQTFTYPDGTTKTLDPEYAHMVYHVANVLGDGRDERLMKQKYTGSAQIFEAAASVQDLWDKRVGNGVPEGNQLMGAMLYTALPFYDLDPDTDLANMPPHLRKLYDEALPLLSNAVWGSYDDIYFNSIRIAQMIQDAGIDVSTLPRPHLENSQQNTNNQKSSPRQNVPNNNQPPQQGQNQQGQSGQQGQGQGQQDQAGQQGQSSQGQGKAGQSQSDQSQQGQAGQSSQGESNQPGQQGQGQQGQGKSQAEQGQQGQSSQGQAGLPGENQAGQGQQGQSGQQGQGSQSGQSGQPRDNQAGQGQQGQSSQGQAGQSSQGESSQPGQPGQQGQASQSGQSGQSQQGQAGQSSQGESNQQGQAGQSQAGQGQSGEGQAGQQGQSSQGQSQAGQAEQSQAGQSAQGQAGQGQSGQGQQGQAGQGQSQAGQSDNNQAGQGQQGQGQAGQGQSGQSQQGQAGQQGQSGQAGQPGNNQAGQSQSGQQGQAGQGQAGEGQQGQSQTGQPGQQGQGQAGQQGQSSQNQAGQSSQGESSQQGQSQAGQGGAGEKSYDDQSRFGYDGSPQANQQARCLQCGEWISPDKVHVCKSQQKQQENGDLSKTQNGKSSPSSTINDLIDNCVTQAGKAIMNGTKEKYSSPSIARNLRKPLNEKDDAFRKVIYKDSEGKLASAQVQLPITFRDDFLKDCEVAAKRDAKPIAKAILEWKHETTATAHNLQKGKLDRRKYKAALTGSSFVYQRRDKVGEAPKIMASMILDTSGSMRNHLESLVQASMSTGLALDMVNESSNDKDDIQYEIRSFNARGRNYAIKSLDEEMAPERINGLRRQDGYTYGAETIALARNAISASSSEEEDYHRLIFVMTDGDFNDHSQSQIELEAARKQGVTTVGIFFGSEDTANAKRTKLDQLYGPTGWVCIESLDEYPNVIKKHLRKVYKNAANQRKKQKGR